MEIKKDTKGIWCYKSFYKDDSIIIKSKFEIKLESQVLDNCFASRNFKSVYEASYKPISKVSIEEFNNELS